MRAQSILSSIYSFFDQAKLDPILQSLKSSEILHEFYSKRIFELIEETLQSEKETAISTVHTENERLIGIIKDLKGQIIQLQTNYQTMLKTNDNTLNAINAVQSETEAKNEENEQLKTYINELQHQLQEIEKQFNILNQENLNLQKQLHSYGKELESKENEINLRNEQIEFIKTNLSLIKQKQDDVNKSLEKMIKSNDELKIEIESKNKTNCDLVKKIEELKLEYQNKNEETMGLIAKLKNENENVLKVKIQALKNKLREKIELIAQLNKKIIS